MEDRLYSIGEVSKNCNISTKALRFYDKLGVISPDLICKEILRIKCYENVIK
ncbi:MerR-like DNA binding protein [Lachnotalea glycerini]|uniref:MerR-like DNA binding protein n=1 Tax=Lachnotalea glycerini TaxID=1763509 RepID=A0A318ELX8_9FIRM|nr:MerR family DNA-binding transcriptional regulator [Lachnotalea glycerini]PXV85346.1 MerR-like DNA binding protein [Lachnotalea glycerini]